VLAGNQAVAVASACIVGASAGFLLYNASPASIFMGDAGSLTLGFAVGGLAVLGNGYGASQNVLLTLIVPIAVLSVPLFDTTLVSVMRTLAGRSISQGGRDHTSHRLVALGLSERQTVRVLYVISAVFGAFAIAAAFLDVLTSMAVLGLLLVALVLFGIYLSQVKVYQEERSAAPEKSGRTIFSVGAAVSQKMPLGEVILDTVLIVVAYLASYLLKFESIIDGPFLNQFAESLPYVIALKLAVLLLSGAYQGAWRYTSLPEGVSLGKASTLGSVASVVAVAVIWRFDDFSRSVFVIDWLLFTWLLVLSRLSFRLLGHWVNSASAAREGRLLVVGNKDHGESVLRAIHLGVFGAFVPAGLVVVGQAVRERRVANVPVLGELSDLDGLLESLEVDGVVTVLEHDPEALAAVVGTCARLGLPCRQIPQLGITDGGATALAGGPRRTRN
jgi:UDP-GlcNAc:undecaprenyl-phosphate GlcNAc-1-phosphate transferase